MEITSVNNELVKSAAKLKQKKYRTKSGKFLLEGYKAIKEAFDNKIKLEYIFTDKKHAPEYGFAGDLVIISSENVLRKIAAADSVPESAAIGYQKKYDKNILADTQKVVLLENIKDLGNLGTIIRSSAAFGVDAVILYGGESVDIYNPKSVRSSAGYLWKTPIIEIRDFKTLEEYFKGYNKIAALPKGEHPLKTFKTKLPCLIMFGSEADGLSDELIGFSASTVKIEMVQSVESLNLASSVSVILYQLLVK